MAKFNTPARRSTGPFMSNKKQGQKSAVKTPNKPGPVAGKTPQKQQGGSASKGKFTPQPSKHQQKKLAAKPVEEDESEDDFDDEDDSMDDDDLVSDEMEESESDNEVPVKKGQLQNYKGTPAPKQPPKQVQRQNEKQKTSAKKEVPGSQKQQQAKPLSKAQASDDDDEEEDDDDEDLDEDEEDSLEDEDLSDEDESGSEPEPPVKKGQLQKQTANTVQQSKQQKAAKKEAPQKQQSAKPSAKSAGAQELDDDEDVDDDEEDDEDEDESDELEDESDELEDESESETEQLAVNGGKAQTKRKAQEVSPKDSSPGQKKKKTNEGLAVPVQNKSMPTNLDKKLQEEEASRKRERDVRSLFIKDMPRNVKDEEIKALSTDIVSVKRKAASATWCWVMFANEQVCEKNYEKLKNAKMQGKAIFVDYCGDKSQSHPPQQTDNRVDALKLYIGNLPSSATQEDLKKQFPEASSVFKHPKKNFAFVNFDKPEPARQAFEKNKNLKINGTQVMVAFAKILEKQEKKSPKGKDPVKEFAKKKDSGKIGVKK